MSALGYAAVDGWVVTKRNLTKIKRLPDLLIFSTIQPIMFVLLFAYVFGGAIKIEGVNYREYLMAGIFTQTVAFGAAITSIGLADDLQKGIIDRFRSLPMSRSAVLVGRTTSDLLNNGLVVIVMSICGLLVGWRIHTDVARGIAGFALLFAFGYAMSWISATIGLSVKSVEVAQSAGFIWLFPLTFLSNAFISTDQLTPWLQKVADWNPISSIVLALRDLWGNSALGAQRGHGYPAHHPILGHRQGECRQVEHLHPGRDRSRPRHRQAELHLPVEVDEPLRVLDVPPRTGVAVVVVAAGIEEQRRQRGAVGERVHDVVRHVAGVVVVRRRAVVGRTVRNGAERVDQLVRGDCDRRHARAALDEHDGEADALRVAAARPADPRLRDGAVVVDERLDEVGQQPDSVERPGDRLEARLGDGELGAAER